MQIQVHVPSNSPHLYATHGTAQCSASSPQYTCTLLQVGVDVHSAIYKSRILLIIAISFVFHKFPCAFNENREFFFTRYIYSSAAKSHWQLVVIQWACAIDCLLHPCTQQTIWNIERGRRFQHKHPNGLRQSLPEAHGFWISEKIL